jgi:hypothetical protein
MLSTALKIGMNSPMSTSRVQRFPVREISSSLDASPFMIHLWSWSNAEK